MGPHLAVDVKVHLSLFGSQSLLYTWQHMLGHICKDYIFTTTNAEITYEASCYGYIVLWKCF